MKSALLSLVRACPAEQLYIVPQQQLRGFEPAALSTSAELTELPARAVLEEPRLRGQLAKSMTYVGPAGEPAAVCRIPP
jgi:hypothetical protein